MMQATSSADRLALRKRAGREPRALPFWSMRESMSHGSRGSLARGVRVQKRHGRVLDLTRRTLLAIAVALAAGSEAQAGGGEWSLQLEPMIMEAYGHDQHVLTIHEIDLDSMPRLDTNTAVHLDTDSNYAYRGEFRNTRQQWGWGIDFLWFNTSQGIADRTAAAAGAIDQVVFEVADRSLASSDPSQVLLYTVLEDTDIAMWTLDFYALRTLAETPASSLRLQFGMRFGDFDNDYRAVVGVQDVGGSRLDASSNYGLMMGPLVGLVSELQRGRNRIEGYIGQSLILGDTELDNMYREFTGQLSTAFPTDADLPTAFLQQGFRAEQDVAIPITEFRLKWTYKLSDHVSVGAGANTSVWLDLPVPPGVKPIENGREALHENTIVFFGMAGIVELTF